MILHGCLLVASILIGASSQYVGDRCVIRRGGGRGTCMQSKDCPMVFDLLRCRNVQPTICGFDGSDSIVCCPRKQVNLDGCQTTTKKPPTRPERISQRKCREYKSCETLFFPAIVGGIDAFPGEFPHMAAIGWPKADGSGFAWNCGGSLISENYVITAAHCTNTRDTSLASDAPTVVRLGEHNINVANDVTPQDIGIANVILHPEYRASSKYHDIALLRLERPAVFGENVRPLCLWQSTTLPSEGAIATGWGKIGYASEASDVLQKVNLNIIDQNTCIDFYKDKNTRRLNRGIIQEQLCAGDLAGGKDTCQGDSGGPLQIPDPQLPCAHHLIGITSFGIGCGGANSPAVYTRISSYLDWIEGIVWQ